MNAGERGLLHLARNGADVVGRLEVALAFGADIHVAHLHQFDAGGGIDRGFRIRSGRVQGEA